MLLNHWAKSMYLEKNHIHSATKFAYFTNFLQANFFLPVLSKQVNG
jgi:hypothetical protein